MLHLIWTTPTIMTNNSMLLYTNLGVYSNGKLVFFNINLITWISLARSHSIRLTLAASFLKNYFNVFAFFYLIEFISSVVIIILCISFKGCFSLFICLTLTYQISCPISIYTLINLYDFRLNNSQEGFTARILLEYCCWNLWST